MAVEYVNRSPLLRSIPVHLQQFKIPDANSFKQATLKGKHNKHKIARTCCDYTKSSMLETSPSSASTNFDVSD